MTISFDAKGVGDADMKKLAAEIMAFPDAVVKTAYQGAFKAAATVLRDEVRATTAFEDRTGTLRRSIRVRTSKPKKKYRAKGTFYGAKTVMGPTGVFFEYGTTRMERRPFFSEGGFYTIREQQIAFRTKLLSDYRKLSASISGRKVSNRIRRQSIL